MMCFKRWPSKAQNAPLCTTVNMAKWKSNIAVALKQRKKVNIAFSFILCFAKHMTFRIIHTVIVSLHCPPNHTHCERRHAMIGQGTTGCSLSCLSYRSQQEALTLCNESLWCCTTTAVTSGWQISLVKLANCFISNIVFSHSRYI